MWPYVGKPLKIRQSHLIQDLQFPAYVIDFTVFSGMRFMPLGFKSESKISS